MNHETAIAGGKYISLLTFRRDGEAVATPVEFVFSSGMIYVRTLPGSGKVKRIRNNRHVRIAPCSMSGRLNGQFIDAVATLVSDEWMAETVNQEFAKKYGILWRVGSRLRSERSQVIRIQLLGQPLERAIR